MTNVHPLLTAALQYLMQMKRGKRNWQMPGDGRYQPKSLAPFLGYDNWAAWLVLVEWFWLETLAEIGEMSPSAVKLLTKKRLFLLLDKITTTRQDRLEKGFGRTKGTKHDILALLKLMRRYLPKPLHRYLHEAATSYDIIDTAYALQLKSVFELVFWPKMQAVDVLWRSRIGENIVTLRAGRTHLQTALPTTMGFWLANLHSRFLDASLHAAGDYHEIQGKFSGAVGTYASQRVLLKNKHADKILLAKLGLQPAPLSTQIVPPETRARFYNELVLLSGVMANLGEDTRILQCSQFGEIISASSSSSAMPHKTANPILAEQDAGMHVSVICEALKVNLTLVSDLERDLRWSNVMRSFSAVMVYCYQQLETTEKLLKSMKFNQETCERNFQVAAKLVVAELLHLSLQRQGFPDAHAFVNKRIVPRAAKSGRDLTAEMDLYVDKHPHAPVGRFWKKVGNNIRTFLQHPELYLGDASKLAAQETIRLLPAL